jgi:hypothetical protein
LCCKSWVMSGFHLSAAKNQRICEVYVSNLG